MSIEVRIPTILRPFTKDQKAVAASGASLTALITDLDSQFPGIGDRLLENGALRRFINIYINIIMNHFDKKLIYTYDHAISPLLCKTIIDMYEKAYDK